MRRLFKKSELGFALVLIAVYVIGFGNAGVLFDDPVPNYAAQIVVGVVLVAFIVGFACKNGLRTYWGLVPFEGSWRKMLWFVPLIVVATENIWSGFGMREDGMAATLLGIAAIGVLGPILEELTMRSILFRAIGRKSGVRAFVICTVTFGVGHLANIAFGRDVMRTLLQVGYALCIGFCLMAVLHTGRSLLPGIVMHALFNSLSFVGHVEEAAGTAADYASVALMCVICLAYGVYLLRAYADERPLTRGPLA